MEAVATLPTYISLSEAAARYGLSEAALRRAVETGIIRGGMLGTQILLVEEDVRRTGRRMPSVAVVDKPVSSEEEAKPEPKLISIEAASRKYDIPVGVLERLIKEHMVRVRNNGERMLVEEDVAGLQHLSRRKFRRLENHGISLSDAEKRYGIPTATISRWARKKKIRTLKRAGKYRYVDESDVAYAKLLADELGMREGRGVLPDRVY